MVQLNERIVGLDAAILMAPKVWEASGHLAAGFADQLVECRKCHKRFRLDEIQNLKQVQNSKSGVRDGLKCPECGGKLTKPRKFNLMMKTFVGPLEEENSLAYMRPETCQGIYVNFKNVAQALRLKLPFGIAQIGKAFRNEITTKNFIFRTREFEQMEMEWFCRPEEADKWFEDWKTRRLNWYLELGVKRENLRLKEIPEKDRAHYAKRQVDLEYKFPFGWKEIEGIHNRGDWDLSRHQKFSGKDLRFFDPSSQKSFIPFIIETSVGVERSLLAFLADAYKEVKGGRARSGGGSKQESEVVLKIHRTLAPIKVAVLPLVRNKPQLTRKAREVYQNLKRHFMSQYDEIGSIGKRYRRQDEIGTPFCVTVDFQTLQDDTVTVRDRDTMKQDRTEIKKLAVFLENALLPPLADNKR